ncbi:Coatomer subunit epsilon [Nakaseomyces bracarensis]|uniref:Coatomer subunit epsilon n=1 Tax=Nakaseomyces bracarensis TaxID=273131 RepID=A0ABR4NRN1_9SACH
MDYFSVKQSYYSGSFDKALEEISKFNKVEDVTLKYYQLRSELALGQLKTTGGSDPLSGAFVLYQAFLQNKDLKKLQQHVEGKGCLFQLNLLACAQAIAGDLEAALQTCVEGIDSDNKTGLIELFLLAIEIALLDGKPSTASTMFENYTSTNADSLTSDDELIVNLAESYIKFATNVDTTSSNFYHFEELAQTFPTWKSQLGLLNLQLQQGNVTEAESIVELLESEYYTEQQPDAAKLYKSNFLANKITLAIMQGDLAKTTELRNELKSCAPDHVYNKSHAELNSKFDEIVVKYKN